MELLSEHSEHSEYSNRVTYQTANTTHRHFPFISSDLQPRYSSTDQHTPRPSPSAPQSLTNHRLSHPFTVPTSNDPLHPSDKFCACHKPSHYSASSSISSPATDQSRCTPWAIHS